MTRSPRILVSGSRRWRDETAIADAISGWLTTTSLTGVPVVVHGGQRTWDSQRHTWFGADWLAGCVARRWGFTEERHPADWNRHGRAAGPIRNTHMISLGADVLLAFPIGESPGTRGCITLAVAAGIPVLDHDPDLRKAA